MERSVLVLRAGVGPRGPLSRRAVAQRVDATVRQVARSERRGLRHLRAAARSGACGGASSAAPAATAPGAGPGIGPAAGAATPAAGREDDGSGADAQGVLGSLRSGGEDAFGGGPADVPAAVLQPPAGADSDPPVLVLLLLALGAGFVAVWAFQHRGRRNARAA